MVREPAPQLSPSLLTLVSIAAFASALVGLTRQVLGQSIATRLLASEWFVTSTFAHVSTPARLAGACGTLATLLLGGLAALLIRVDNRLTAGWYFFWTFGCVSLMNSGRLLYSAITNTGDWSAVIASFHPAALWRILIGAAGVFIYRPAMRFAVSTARGLIEGRELSYRQLWLLIVVTYLTTSIVLTAGAILDPINTGLMPRAVLAASFGLNLGLLFIPAFISEPVDLRPSLRQSISFSWLWVILGAAATAAFLAGLGRAIRF
jgi:hypothetical protein